MDQGSPEGASRGSPVGWRSCRYWRLAFPSGCQKVIFRPQGTFLVIVGRVRRRQPPVFREIVGDLLLEGVPVLNGCSSQLLDRFDGDQFSEGQGSDLFIQAIPLAPEPDGPGGYTTSIEQYCSLTLVPRWYGLKSSCRPVLRLPEEPPALGTALTGTPLQSAA